MSCALRQQWRGPSRAFEALAAPVAGGGGEGGCGEEATWDPSWSANDLCLAVPYAGADSDMVPATQLPALRIWHEDSCAGCSQGWTEPSGA